MSDGVTAIADVVVPAADTIADALPSFTQNAAGAASAADTLAGTAAQTAGSVAAGASSVQGQVTALGQAHPELQSDPTYQELVRVTGQAAGFANQVDSSATALKSTTASVGSAAQQLAQNAPALQTEVRNAATKITALKDGAASVASGAEQLDSGLGTAATGASSLHDGITQLTSGSSSLASGLTDAEARIPVLSADQKKSNAETLASPVDVATANLHPASTYGRGLTPFPYETLPGFFRALHWFLPMSYFVDGLRVTITGGNEANLLRDALVLGGFLVVALTLTTLVVRRRREWTVGRLKPALSI